MTLDASEVKTAAQGRWRDILVAVAGIPADHLDGRHHPCPQCNGTDRFRCIDISVGAVFCNKCFSDRNGDGLAAVQWMRGCDFQDALAAVADHVGLKPMNGSASAAPQLDPVARMAAVKSCSAESLREFGASVNGDGKSVYFPAYGPDRKQCTTFKVAPGATGKLGKGLFAKGKPAGLFFPMGDQGPRFPTPGETWIICEGVKDAAAYHALEYLACGLNTDHLSQKFVPLFQGVHVILMPDRTGGAEAKAKTSAARLAGVAASIKIGVLPLPLDGDKGDDVRDALKQRDGEQCVRAAIKAATAMHAGTGEDAAVRRVTLKDAVSERLPTYKQGPIPRVKVGIPRLDRVLGGGLPFGNFVIVGALSSHGKTAFSLQTAHRIAGEQRIPVAFLTLEQGIGELADRTMSYASDAPKEDWHRLLHQLERDTTRHFDQAAPITVIEGASELSDVERELEQAFNDGSRVAFVDYAQLVSAGSRDDTNAIVRRVSARFKQIAKQHNGIVVALAQLNKRVQDRKPLIPLLTDIEYGTKLGHDADVVLFLVWPHRIDQSQPYDQYQIFVEKNRNGQSKTTIHCKFNPPRQRFDEAAEPTARDMANYDPNLKFRD